MDPGSFILACVQAQIDVLAPRHAYPRFPAACTCAHAQHAHMGFSQIYALQSFSAAVYAANWGVQPDDEGHSRSAALVGCCMDSR